MTTSWHSYPSIYAIGHRYIADLLKDPVVVEEKIDGSQFSFGVFQGDEGPFVRCRSKGCELNIIAPDNMFKRAVETVLSIQDKLHIGWTYRGEYLQKPKHNALAYDRIPKSNIIIFDVNSGHEEYLPPSEKAEEAERIGLDVVPVMKRGFIDSAEEFRALLDNVSCLGGQKIEGVVIKNYSRFGQDKKAMMGKFVSEAFKEVHAREWKASNPTVGDVIANLIFSLKTDARWHKSVVHLKERGILEESPRDIGNLIKEVKEDVKKEEEDFIKQKLFEYAWPHIQRGIVGGLPEWYKEQLLKLQFEREA